MWGVLGQSGRCVGSSADWLFSAGITNEAPLSHRLAIGKVRLAVIVFFVTRGRAVGTNTGRVFAQMTDSGVPCAP